MVWPFKKFLIYFGLCWVFVAMCGFSLVSVCGLLIAVACLVEHGLSSCGFMGLVASHHVDSSWTRD